MFANVDKTADASVKGSDIEKMSLLAKVMTDSTDKCA